MARDREESGMASRFERGALQVEGFSTSANERPPAVRTSGHGGNTTYGIRPEKMLANSPNAANLSQKIGKNRFGTVRTCLARHLRAPPQKHSVAPRGYSVTLFPALGFRRFDFVVLAQNGFCIRPAPNAFVCGARLDAILQLRPLGLGCASVRRTGSQASPGTPGSVIRRRSK